MKLYLSNIIRPKILICSSEKEEQDIEKLLTSEELNITVLSARENIIKNIEENPPDLIITSSDISEILKAFSPEKFDCTPVIAIIKEEKKDTELSIPPGVDEIIFEPVSKLELLTRIKNLLNLAWSQKKILKKTVENAELLTFKEDILRILVHDMGNSVSGIVGSLDLLKLQSTTFTEKQNKNLNRVNESAKELLQIIKNIADILHGKDAGKYNMVPVDFTDIIEELELSTKAFFNYNKRELVIENKEEHLIVKGTEELLKRVMENLVGNAIKNTPSRGKVTVSITKEENSPNVKVSIKDEGKALPEEFRKKIFNLYGQLEIFDKGYRVGRGFSITYCQMAINIMGGKIWMEGPEEEKGNCFSFTLPLIR